MISFFEKQPNKLILLDGWGAIISTFFTGFILVGLHETIVIPPKTLYILATFPALFAILDFCFFFYQKIIRNHSLQIIAFLNLTYCVVSILFAIHHLNTITIFGWAYIIIELLILFCLVYIELNVAHKMRS